MKKIVVLLIGILVFSIVFTACGTPAETPSDVDSTIEQTVGVATQEKQEDIQQENNEQQEDTAGEKEAGSTTTKVEGSSVEAVPSKESKAEQKPVETASKVTSKTTASKVVEQPNEKENADVPANPTPEFTTIATLQNWMLSQNSTDQFAQDRQDLLSTMVTGNQIVYYRPVIGNGNDLLQLDNVAASHGVLRYFYGFIDEEYQDLQLRISCYMDDTEKEFYNDIKTNVQNNVDGCILVNVNDHDIVYYDNQYGVTVFCWQQFGGYIYASLKGENHADKVQDVLPYLNLEKVTLRTDTVTQ